MTHANWACQNAGAGVPAHVCHVWRYGAGAHPHGHQRVYGTFCLQAWAHCCFTCLPRQGARISRVQLRFSGRLCGCCALGADGTPSEMLPYAAGGVVVAGFIYVVLAALIKVFGVKRIMRFSRRWLQAHHHRHRPYSGAQRHYKLPVQLAAGFHCAGHYCGVQHLGQRHGKNFAHPHWHCGLVHCGPVDGGSEF